MKKTSMTGETICGTGIIIFATILCFWSYNAPKQAMLWPRITLGITFILTILMMYLAYLGKGVAKPKVFTWGGPTFFMMIASVVYILLLNIVGFLILTPIWCFITFKIMGYKKNTTNFMVSLILTVIVFCIFKKLLYVPVPLGPLSNLIF